MAGDWIKMQMSTPDKPEVWAMAEALDLDPDAVVGKLFRVWCWFDQHTENGHAPAVTKKLLDREVNVPDFCLTLIKVGWMTDDGETIALPNFDRHNGKTAKNRALSAERKQRQREKSHDGVLDESRDDRDNTVTREEKRREEVKEENNRSSADAPDRFADFWDAYPKKVKKQDARKKWKSRKLDRLADQIITDVQARQERDRRWLDGYVPDPTTYLNGSRWEDEIESSAQPKAPNEPPLPEYLN